MKRSETYMQQQAGYKAFIPVPLPPQPTVKIEGNEISPSAHYVRSGHHSTRIKDFTANILYTKSMVEAGGVEEPLRAVKY
jgi:hypothetical protein